MYLSKDKAHPSVLSEGIISSKAIADEIGTFNFRLPASSKGRVQAVVRMPTSSKVSDVRRALHRQEQFEEGVEMIEFWTDTGEHMDMKKNIMHYYPHGTCTGTILIKGGFRELYIAMAGVEFGMSLRYDVHMTLTDVIQCILVKLKTICGDPELVDLTRVQLCFGEKKLPIELCFTYPNFALSEKIRLCDINLGKEGEPCTVMFKRSRDGVNAFFVLPMSGEQNIYDVKEMVYVKQREENLKQGDTGWVAGVLHPKKVLTNAIVWDDEDENVSPCGVRTVYVYRPGDKGYEAAPELDLNETYLSFHPPPRGLPQLVSIHENYAIPHLSDLGILPGTTLTLSFFSSSLKQWSHNIAAPQPDISEDVSIKIVGGPVIRLPVVMDTPLEELYVTLWRATGMSPHETVLLTDEGRLLHRADSMTSLGLLPETILLCKTQQGGKGGKGGVEK